MIMECKIEIRKEDIKLTFNDNLYGILIYIDNSAIFYIYHNELEFDCFIFYSDNQYNDINTCIEYINDTMNCIII